MDEVLKIVLTGPLPQKQAPEKERPEAVVAAPAGLPGAGGGGETPPKEQPPLTN